MNRLLVIMKLVIAGFLCIGVYGCGGSTEANRSFESSPSTQSQLQKINAREYVITVSQDDYPLLEAECTYLGKKPQDIKTFQSKFKHDYHTNNTDFYQVTLTNKSSHAMVMQSANYRMGKGGYRGKSKFDSKGIAATWGRSKIAPQESVQRDTHFVWAVKGSNTLYKTYSLSGKDKTGAPIQFKVEIPLLYQR